jgi:hypothetical protein
MVCEQGIFLPTHHYSYFTLAKVKRIFSKIGYLFFTKKSVQLFCKERWANISSAPDGVRSELKTDHPS